MLNQTSKKRICIVDDEPLRVAPWIELLREHYHVEVFADASEAIQHLDRPDGYFDLLIWDMMLPASTDMDPRETQHGTRTGTLVYRAFRRHHKHQPAILLTHVRDDRMLTSISARINERVARKQEVLPADLHRWVQEMVGA